DARRTRERCEARVNHPEELLAAFADGTASLEERAEVEAHLAFCEDCLREVELARSAHAALRALPEVEAPPTDLRALDFAGGWLPPAARAPAATGEAPPHTGLERGGPFGTADRAGIGAGSGRRRWIGRTHFRWPVRAAQAGLVVAGLIVAVVLVSRLGGGPSGTASRAGGAGAPHAPRAEAIPSPSLPPGAQRYTTASFGAFASDLAREAKRTKAGAASGGATLSPAASPVFGANSTSVALTCMQSATGVVAGTQLYYFQ